MINLLLVPTCCGMAPYFTNQETKAQRSQAPCSESQSCGRAWTLIPVSGASEGQALFPRHHSSSLFMEFLLSSDPRAWLEIRGDLHRQPPLFLPLLILPSLSSWWNFIWGRGSQCGGNTFLGPPYFLPLCCSRCRVAGAEVTPAERPQP